MQARVRENSSSDVGWEEISMPEDIRSLSSFSDDEIFILKGPRAAVAAAAAAASVTPNSEASLSAASSRTELASLATMPREEILTIQLIQAPPPIDVLPTLLPIPKEIPYPLKSIESPERILSPNGSSIAPKKPSSEKGDSALSPIEKTLVQQITRLSEQLELSRHQNDVLEQTIHRDDFPGGFPDDSGHTMLLRLGLRTLGFFVLLSVVQRRFLISGLVSIFGAAVVGGMFTYIGEQERRQNERE